MKVSVLVPAYNSASTIRATLESVFRQTVPADEILVMDDGSTDETASILESLKPRISAFHQPNAGVGSARNALCARAQGDLIAFLDSDDLLHPRYLEVQRKLFEAYPNAVAYFTGHVNFHGDGDYKWKTDPAAASFPVEVIPSLEFFKRYSTVPAPFGFCCNPRKALLQLGERPFEGRVAEDAYCLYRLALLGDVVHAAAPLAAYRIRTNSLASSNMRTFSGCVTAYELLEAYYKEHPSRDYYRLFKVAFASKRRSYARLLMGAGRVAEARAQIVRSLLHSGHPSSLAKSMAFLMLTYMPRQLQPRWPESTRKVGSMPAE